MQSVIRLPRFSMCTGRPMAVGALLLLLLLPAFPATQTDSVLAVGEELTYNVSYASFDIGRVKLKVVGTEHRNEKLCYRTEAVIDSYRGVPFVNLHTVYESVIGPDGYSSWFSARDKTDHGWKSYVYSFDYPRHVVAITEKLPDGSVNRKDTIRIDDFYQDGLSLLYYTRFHVKDRGTPDVPTMVMEKKGKTAFNFSGERRPATIEAVRYPVDCVHFTGEAGFVGVFGLTGGFEGSFSNDAARVPIIASLRVLIGSVHVELTSWKRNGWTPPEGHPQ